MHGDIKTSFTKVDCKSKLNYFVIQITQIFHEPLERTYIEFIISVDNVTVTRKIVKETFDVGVAELSDDLNQEVSL